MINNNPIYEIQEEREEVEEDINTNRDLVFERLNTEYADEDEGVDYDIIAKELNKYIETSAVFLVALIILQFALIFSQNPGFALSPLILVEFKRLFINIIEIKTFSGIQDSDTVRISSLKNLLTSLGNLFLYSLLVAYASNFLHYFIITPVPLVISFTLNFIIKQRASNQCRLFSRIVTFT